MWLSDRQKLSVNRRRFITLAAALPVAACGFEPVLAPGGSLARLRNRIRIADPKDRNEFILKSELETRLGRGSEFDLSYTLTTSETGVGITPDQVITRQQVNGSLEFSLTDSGSDEELFKGTLASFTSYGTTDTTATTTFAREAAYERLMVIFADQIVSRLAAVDGFGT